MRHRILSTMTDSSPRSAPMSNVNKISAHFIMLSGWLTNDKPDQTVRTDYAMTHQSAGRHLNRHTRDSATQVIRRQCQLTSALFRHPLFVNWMHYWTDGNLLAGLYSVIHCSGKLITNLKFLDYCSVADGRSAKSNVTTMVNFEVGHRIRWLKM